MAKGARKAAAKVAEAVRMITAWSYSRYKDYRTCARLAHWKHILKRPVLVDGVLYEPGKAPKSPAMQRGGDIHKEGEDYLLGRKKTLPGSFKTFKKEMEELRRLKAEAEGKWAVDSKWRPVDYFDWARAWLRVVLDARVVLKGAKARVIDFKTGKVYPDDNEEQMELYAAVAFEHFPEVEEVDVELWYLDQPRGKLGLGGGQVVSNPIVKTYRGKQAPALRKKWDGKVLPMLTDKRFIPNPGRHCSWCDYSRRKGGDCEH